MNILNNYTNSFAFSFAARMKKPNYIFNDDLSYTKYEDSIDTAKALNCDVRKVENHLRLNSLLIQDKFIISAKQIEEKDENGQIVLLKNIFKKVREKFSQHSLYAIDIDGNIKKYSSVKEATEVLNMPENSIRCAVSTNKVINGYAFYRAKDVEIINDDGSVNLNKKILQFPHGKKLEMPVYLLKISDNSYTRYENVKELIAKTGLNKTAIYQNLDGYNHRTGEYICISANEVETKDNDGNVEFDFRVFNSAKSAISAFEKPIYAIYSNGEYKRYNSVTEASEDTDFSRRIVYEGSLENKIIKRNVVFANADEIEKFNSRGDLIVDKKLIKKISKKIKDNNKSYIVYAFKDDGSYMVFNTAKEASEKLNVAHCNIAHCISGQRKSAGGYRFYSAKDVEDEKGQVKSEFLEKV